jgi:hypothetical protein
MSKSGQGSLSPMAFLMILRSARRLVAQPYNRRDGIRATRYAFGTVTPTRRRIFGLTLSTRQRVSSARKTRWRIAGAIRYRDTPSVVQATIALRPPRRKRPRLLTKVRQHGRTCEGSTNLASRRPPRRKFPVIPDIRTTARWGSQCRIRCPSWNLDIPSGVYTSLKTTSTAVLPSNGVRPLVHFKCRRRYSPNHAASRPSVNSISI